MTRLLPSLLLALAFVATGCDSAGPEAASADFRGDGPPGSCQFAIAGPSQLAAGQTATYYITAQNNCLIQDTDWHVGLGATVVSSDQTTAQIQAGTWTNSFRIEAYVSSYENGYILTLTDVARDVTITP